MKRLFDEPFENHYDIIVIGGGITGVCVAYEAATRGLKVALFEKDDFGQATSAATSKLIHGGLRYLKNFEYGLVRESLTERKVWENIAPNFVYPIPFMVPTYSNLKSNKVVLFIGMVLYDLLSLDKAFTWDDSKKLPLHKTISASKTLKLETCVPNKKLTGSSIYYDCQNINPERLTLGVLKSAMVLGAKASNYARVKSFVINENEVKGVNVVDLITQKEHRFTADITINCTGPWTDIVLNSANSNTANNQHHIRRSEGIHILTKKLCHKHAITIMTKDGRHVMIMPWRNHTLIGTTDKVYHGSPDDYCVTRESIQGLIDEINENFGFEKLKYSDVQFAYGGLRPLVDDQTKESYETSRKYEIYDNSKEGLDGLITVEGGKYTTSRKLASQTINVVAKKLKRDLGLSVTNKRYLSDSDIKNMESFIKQLVLRYPQFSEATINYIGRNYGLQCHTIFRLAMYDKPLAQVLNDDGEILAEVVYVLKKEMAYTLTDVFFRRTGLGTLGFPGGETFTLVMNTVKDFFKWDEKRTQDEIDKVMKVFNLPK